MKRAAKFFLPAIMVLALVNALILFVHRVMTNGDNLDYLFIAGAVGAGHWNEPFQWRFPVGYPYWVAILSWLGGGVIGTNPLSVSTAAIYGIKMAGVAMAPLAVAAVYLWARAVVASPATTWLLALLMATTQVWAPMYSMIGAEPYFLVSVWLALWGWEKTLTAEFRARGLWLAVACGASIVAILFRQLGLAVPLAVVLAMAGRAVMDRKGISWLPLTGALAVGLVGVWLMMLNTSHLGQLAGAGSEQVNLMSAKWSLFCANAEAYRMTIPHLLLPKVFGDQGALGKVGFDALEIPLVILLGGLMLAGMWSILRERRAGLVSTLFVIINIGIILVWPYRDGRFFVPLLPALWFLVLRGSQWLGSVMPVAAVRRAQGAVVVIVLLAAWQQATTGFAGLKNLRTAYDLRALPAWHPARYEITGELDFADHLACGLWLAENVRPGAAIFAEKSKFIELASGHTVSYLGIALADGSLAREAVANRELLIVDDIFPDTAGYGRAKLAFRAWADKPDAPRFEPVYRAPHGATVYRVEKSTTDLSGRSQAKPDGHE